jgi:hypothetical protein
VLLTVSVSNKGGFRLATKAGMYIRIDSDEDDCLKADAVDYLSAYTIFDIGLQNAVPSVDIIVRLDRVSASRD